MTVRSRRGPTSLNSYLHAHLGHMTTFEESGVVVLNGLSVAIVSPDVTRIAGNVHLRDNVVIEVDKTVETVRRSARRKANRNAKRKVVKTTNFRYHAHRQGLSDGNILRCESGHDDHNCRPHRHDYPVLGVDEYVMSEYGDDEQIPTLAEFIEEVEEWRAGNPIENDPRP